MPPRDGEAGLGTAALQPVQLAQRTYLGDDWTWGDVSRDLALSAALGGALGGIGAGIGELRRPAPGLALDLTDGPAAPPATVESLAPGPAPDLIEPAAAPTLRPGEATPTQLSEAPRPLDVAAAAEPAVGATATPNAAFALQADLGPAPRFTPSERLEAAANLNLAIGQMLAHEDVNLGPPSPMHQPPRQLGGDADIASVRKPIAGDATRYRVADGHAWLQFEDGSLDFGRVGHELAGELGVGEGEIRLSRGYHDPATGSGRGEAHIEAGHGDEIRKRVDADGRPYAGVAEYVRDVLDGYTEIRRGKRGELIFVMETGPRTDQTAYLSVSRDAKTGVYDVITAGPRARPYLRKNPEVWSRNRNRPAGSAGETRPSRPSAPTEANAPTSRSGRDQTVLDIGAGPGEVNGKFQRPLHAVYDPRPPDPDPDVAAAEAAIAEVHADDVDPIDVAAGRLPEDDEYALALERGQVAPESAAEVAAHDELRDRMDGLEDAFAEAARCLSRAAP